MSNYTKGPWGVIHMDKVSYVHSKTVFADVFSEAYGDTENQQANAKLIACAPEMAEMLLETYQRGCFRASPNEVEALLKKAGVL